MDEGCSGSLDNRMEQRKGRDNIVSKIFIISCLVSHRVHAKLVDVRQKWSRMWRELLRLSVQSRQCMGENMFTMLHTVESGTHFWLKHFEDVDYSLARHNRLDAIGRVISEDVIAKCWEECWLRQGRSQNRRCISTIIVRNS
jgi:hypothetical protein